MNRIKYFILGLDSYDNYLRKKLKLGIKNIDIYSKIISDSTLDKDEVIRLTAEAFERSNTMPLIHSSKSTSHYIQSALPFMSIRSLPPSQQIVLLATIEKPGFV